MIVIRPTPSSGSAGGSRGSSSGGSSSGTKPRWSNRDLPFPTQPPKYNNLTPIRQTVEKLVAEKPDLRDVFPLPRLMIDKA